MTLPTTIQDLLPKVAAKYHIDSTVEASHLLRRFDTKVAELLGGEGYAKGAYVRNTTLVAYVTSAAVAQELHLHKFTLLDHLEHYTQGRILTSIITKQQRSLGIPPELHQ